MDICPFSYLVLAPSNIFQHTHCLWVERRFKFHTALIIRVLRHAHHSLAEGRCRSRERRVRSAICCTGGLHASSEQERERCSSVVNLANLALVSNSSEAEKGVFAAVPFCKSLALLQLCEVLGVLMLQDPFWKVQWLQLKSTDSLLPDSCHSFCPKLVFCPSIHHRSSSADHH